jgi:beta-galactosidase
VKHGTSNNGKPTHYFLNYSGEAQSFVYAYADGTDLLTGKRVAHSASLSLQPWDLTVVQEPAPRPD